MPSSTCWPVGEPARLRQKIVAGLKMPLIGLQLGLEEPLARAQTVERDRGGELGLHDDFSGRKIASQDRNLAGQQAEAPVPDRIGVDRYSPDSGIGQLPGVSELAPPHRLARPVVVVVRLS